MDDAIRKPQSWETCDVEIYGYITGFVDLLQQKLGKCLTGVYLHGSLAMGSYFPPKSDMDMLAVVDKSLEVSLAEDLNFSIARYSERRPTTGDIEFSVITSETAKNVPDEMPYELHYSEMWKQRIFDRQVTYGVRQIDPDLPAHLMCVKKRGVCLYGTKIGEAFGEVSWHNFMLAVLDDFDWIVMDENICESPYYGVLNICRVLQMIFEKNRKILSKYEGGMWGVAKLPAEYTSLIQKVLAVYSSDKPIDENNRKTGGVGWDKHELCAFRDYAKRERCVITIN